MDLITLPDEMLLNILKFNSYGRNRLLRKVNARIDRLAKRAKLTRIPVEHLEINYESIVLRYNKIVLEIGNGNKLETARATFPANQIAVRLKKLAWILVNIKVASTIYLTEIELSDEIVQCFSKSNFRFLTDILLENVTFSLPRESSKHFFAMWPRVNDLWIRNCDGQLENVIDKEVLGHQKWKSLYIESDTALLHPTSFLLDIATNANVISFDIPNCLFTVAEVSNALKIWTLGGNFDRQLKLGKASLGGMLLVDVPQFLKANVPGIRFGRESDATFFKIKFDGWTENSFVQFYIHEI